MNIILENYLIIVIVGLFFIFALIGYLIDMFRNNKKEEIQTTMQNNNIPETNQENIQIINPNQNKGDELLNNYNEKNSE